jgi:tetratricopeptide (TPR) repeat protein
VVFFYFSQMLFPHPSRLNIDHGFSLSHSLLDPPTTLLAGLGIAALLAIGILSAPRHRLLSFSVLWVLGNLAGESSCLGLEMVFEHRMYLPSVMVLAVMVLLARRCTSRQPAFWLTLGIVGIAFGTWTYQRNHVWSDDLLLWSDAAAKSERKARPFNNLGDAYADRGNVERARESYLKAVEIDPNFAQASYNLGLLAHDANRREEAAAYYLKALQAKPGYAEVHNNLGLLEMEAGNAADAEKHFVDAVRLKPLLAEPRLNLADLLLGQGKTDEAVNHLNAAASAVTLSGQLHTRLAHLFFRAGSIGTATSHYARALKLEPESADAFNNLAVALVEQGRKGDAIKLWREAVRLDPTHRAAKKNLARALED